MKNDISRYEYIISGKIKKLIAFHTKRITNEDTRFGSWTKLGSVVTQSRSKTQTTKDFEIRIGRYLIIEFLIRGCFENR